MHYVVLSPHDLWAIVPNGLSILSYREFVARYHRTERVMCKTVPKPLPCRLCDEKFRSFLPSPEICKVLKAVITHQAADLYPIHQVLYHSISRPTRYSSFNQGGVDLYRKGCASCSGPRKENIDVHLAAW